MMRSLAITLGLGLFVTESVAMAAFFGVNTSHLRARCEKNPQGPSYGKNTCRCVGIDNLKGYYAKQVNFRHVQYDAETGASCAAWDKGKHPECKGGVTPQWCNQEWCYVDPCSCDLEVPPKVTTAGIEYQGGPAYWSYATCGSTDFWSQEDKDACVMQTSKADCEKKSKCAWDGKQCGGVEIVKTCKEGAKKDESVHGQEDCRCIGLGGKDVGKAFLHINDKYVVSYSPNVGATCDAWEMHSHPDCLKDGEKPSWCSNRWCFVDPCKCKTKEPPRTVMPANQAMRYQGKTAYWSYEACGGVDTFSSSHKDMYCSSQKSALDCTMLDKCTWTGKQCLSKEVAEICSAGDHKSGSSFPSTSAAAFILTLGALATM